MTYIFSTQECNRFANFQFKDHVSRQTSYISSNTLNYVKTKRKRFARRLRSVAWVLICFTAFCAGED